MVGLLDIAPVAETVSIRGSDIAVNGLSLTDIRDLLVTFPDAPALFADGVNAAALLAAAPDLVAAAICLATGYKATKDEREAVKRLPAGDQVKLVNAIVKLSAPDGIGPFVELIVSLGNGAGSNGGQSTKASATTSRPRPRAAPVMATIPPR
ncbi:MAG: hypothetical protein ABFD96_25425 [Armatimonadia bacterium]